MLFALYCSICCTLYKCFVLRVSCLTMNLDFMWGENREVKMPAATLSQAQDTSGLSRQCSATEPRQSDKHQPLFLPHNI